MYFEHWTKGLQQDQPVFRHYENRNALDELVLTAFSIYDYTFQLTLVCLNTPDFRSKRWPSEANSGIELTLGGLQQRANIANVSLDTNSRLRTRICKLKGIQEIEGEWKEILCDGVTLEVIQNDSCVISADLACL